MKGEKMAPNSRYLTVALDIRKISDSLIRLAEEGIKPPSLDDSIRQLVVSLQNVGEKTSVKALRERGAFGRYDSLRAVTEVIKPEQRNQLIGKLQAVMSSTSAALQRENALDAIDYFDAIERRALYHYNHSKDERRPALSR